MLRQNTGYFDGWYVVPSGHVEAGELPTDGAVREVAEEVGLTIDRTRLVLAHTMYRTKHDATGDRADYFFVVDKWEGEPINKEPGKCA
jgi:8-oxo-dGTP diphosphatase